MIIVERRLLVFCKYPEPGKAKTRLAQSIGETDAALIAKRLLELTVERLAPLSAQGVTLILFVAPAERGPEFSKWIGSPWRIEIQPEGDLGDRLESAFSGTSADTIVVGSDCPGITAQAITETFEQITDQQMVFGPTRDGGFYVMGARRVPTDFFRNIRWSSEVTLKQLRDRAASSGIEIALQPELYDVDTETDLLRWKSERAGSVNIGETWPRPE